MPTLSSLRPALRAAGTRLTPSRAATRPPSATDRSRTVPHGSVVDCAVYVDGVRLPGAWTPHAAVTAVRERGTGFVWIGLHEPDDEQITGVAEVFGLHELAVEDAVHAHQRPKLERYDEMLAMVLKTLAYVGDGRPRTASEVVETGEVMVFLGADFVITVRHGRHGALREVRTRLEDDPEHLALGPAAVLHAVADHIVDSYLAVTAAIADDIDEMETEVFSPRSTLDAEQIYVLKREVLELRRAVVPLGAPLRKLSEGYSALVAHDVRSYFRDVDDHLVTAADRVAGFNELLTTLVDAALAKITMRQNGDMRKITAYAAIITVPTMIAGIYGMNFEHMPELDAPWGYPAVLLTIGTLCTLLYRNFRRNGWL